MKIDYNKVFNVKVRNVDCLLHDICKLILVSLLKKKNPNTPIYTEHNPENPNDSYPDIFMRLKDRRYIWEIQKEITEKWKNKIIEKYNLPKYDLFIVPIKDLPTDINKLKEELEKYVI